jgi:hypothetical protein
MTDLIYFFVRANDYRQMLVECIKSLRGAGGYRGDILVFAETICPLMNGLANSPGVMVQHATWMRDAPIMLDRITAAQHIPLPQCYRTITLLDSDILAVGDISPLLDDENAVRYMEEPWQIYGELKPGHPTDMYLSAMTPAERASVTGLHPINVGHITWPGHLHVGLISAWIATIAATPDVWGRDQATFNAIIRRGLVYSRPYGVLDVANATMTPEKAWCQYRLVHFAGYGNRLQKMRALTK